MATKKTVPTAETVKNLITEYASVVSQDEKKAGKIAAKIKSLDATLLKETYREMSSTEENHLLGIVPNLFEDEEE